MKGIWKEDREDLVCDDMIGRCRAMGIDTVGKLFDKAGGCYVDTKFHLAMGRLGLRCEMEVDCFFYLLILYGDVGNMGFTPLHVVMLTRFLNELYDKFLTEPL